MMDGDYKMPPDRDYPGFLKLLADYAGEDSVDCGFTDETVDSYVGSCLINAYNAGQAAYGVYRDEHKRGADALVALPAEQVVYFLSYSPDLPEPGEPGEVDSIHLTRCLGASANSPARNYRSIFLCEKEKLGLLGATINALLL